MTWTECVQRMFAVLYAVGFCGVLILGLLKLGGVITGSTRTGWKKWSMIGFVSAFAVGASGLVLLALT